MPLDLHVAENMESLYVKSDYQIPKTTTYARCLELMDKLHRCSVQSKKDQDEETEFMFLHRYMVVTDYFSKIPKDNSNRAKSSKKKEEYARASGILIRYQELQTTLKARYEARRKASKSPSDGNVVHPDSNNISDASNKVAKSALPSSVAAEKGFIECNQLFALIKSRPKKDLLLIFDVRSSNDFKESHIDFHVLLNIPEEIIASGLTASTLGKKLAGPDKAVWDKRSDADILVLMDWSSSSLSPHRSSKVFVLQNIIRQWDPLTSYKARPLILEGGYEEIIERYPQITTNPKVQIPRLPSVTSMNALKNLEYPLEDLEPERPKTTPPAPKPDPPPEVRHSTSASIDRAKKPPAIAKTQVPDVNLNSLIDELGDYLSDESTLGPSMSQEAEGALAAQVEPPPPNTITIEDSSSDDEYPSGGSLIDRVTGRKGRSVIQAMRSRSHLKRKRRSFPFLASTQFKPALGESKKPDAALVDDLRKFKPAFNNKNGKSSVSRNKGPSMDGDRPSSSNKPKSATTYNTSGISHEPLKKDNMSGGILRRSSSSPNIKEISDDEPMGHHTPSFSRANKPSTLKVQHSLYNERADSTYGKTAPGLTGLKNFANNCYMNSILQCLNNTEPLVKELLRLKSSHPVNARSRLKGRIVQEVLAAFRSMWSGEIKVYSIRELKSLMGEIKDIFRGSMHQDSNEFLIILLEHLHEDLNMPAEEENLVGAVEETGEKAWGEFRQKNCSIIQQLFYGQHRSTVTCSTCGHNSATFEQFFNLFVPIPPSQYSASLNDCIQLYMSGERISGWKCPNCKVERNATKKFDISRLPPVLIIALKRFTQEDGSWLHKKENLVSYPLTNLDMSRFTVPGSEQRCQVYDLYAMSTHSGTLQSGHYRAICKSWWNNKWYMFDDQSVDLLTESSVLTNPEVYIMFYIAKQS